MKKTVHYVSWFIANLMGLGMFTSVYLNVAFPTSSVALYTIKVSLALIVWVAIAAYFVQKWSLFSIIKSTEEVSS